MSLLDSWPTRSRRTRFSLGRLVTELAQGPQRWLAQELEVVAVYRLLVVVVLAQYTEALVEQSSRQTLRQQKMAQRVLLRKMQALKKLVQVQES
jgi:hypothetical protein